MNIPLTSLHSVSTVEWSLGAPSNSLAMNAWGWRQGVPAGELCALDPATPPPVGYSSHLLFRVQHKPYLFPQAFAQDGEIVGASNGWVCL